MIASLLGLGLLYYLCLLRVFYWTHYHREFLAGVSSEVRVQTFQNWLNSGPVMPGFKDYTQAKLVTLLAGIFSEVLRCTMLMESVVVIFELVPLFCLFMAMRKWTEYSTSRAYVITAWAVAFATPLLVSIFPLRLITDFSVVEGNVDSFLRELAVPLHFADVQRLVMNGCERIQDEDVASLTNKISNSLHQVCDMLVSVSHMVLTEALNTQAFHAAINNCPIVALQFDRARAQRVAMVLVHACHGGASLLNAANATAASSALHSSVVAGPTGGEGFSSLVSLLDEIFRDVMPSFEVVTVATSIIHVIFTASAPVLAVAPGFVCAAVATKLMLPHAEAPGVIMIVMPVCFTCSAWVVYTIIFQYSTNVVHLSLLATSLFVPVAFVIIGAVNRVTKPTSKHKLLWTVRLLRIGSMMFTCVVFAIALVLSRVENRLLQAEWMQGIRMSMSALQLAFAVALFFFWVLTSFGVTDWMVSDCSAQQRFWQRKLSRKQEHGRKTAMHDMANRMTSRDSSFLHPFGDAPGSVSMIGGSVSFQDKRARFNSMPTAIEDLHGNDNSFSYARERNSRPNTFDSQPGTMLGSVFGSSGSVPQQHYMDTDDENENYEDNSSDSHSGLDDPDDEAAGLSNSYGDYPQPSFDRRRTRLESRLDRDVHTLFDADAD